MKNSKLILFNNKKWDENGHCLFDIIPINNVLVCVLFFGYYAIK